jgi:hypothetical protein
MLKERNRKINEDKQLLNLFIKYKREYLKDNDFKNIYALHQENSKKIKLYFEPTQFKNKDHYFLSDRCNKIINSIEKEKDNRKIKTLKKELNKLKPQKQRYDEIVKIKSTVKSTGKLLSNIIEPYDDKENIDTNPEAYNNIYDSLEDSSIIEIDNIMIDPKEILEFDYHLHILCELFGLDKNNNSVINVLLSLLPIQMEEGDISEYYKTGVSQWIDKSKKVDNAILYLLSSGYINLSRKKALTKITNNDAKWLLTACNKYEKRNNCKITLKRDTKNYNIKSKILHQIFKKWFDTKTAETITKYSSLINKS